MARVIISCGSSKLQHWLGSSFQGNDDLRRVRDLLVPFLLLAGGVDVRLGWRVLSSGIFHPTNTALDAFHRVHEVVFRAASLGLHHIHEHISPNQP